MNRIELLRMLRRHQKLSERRSPIWEQNKIGKAFIWFMAAFMVMYLLFIAVMLSLMVNNAQAITGYEFMYGILPFILTLDFLLRFFFQQTPSQLVKPYSLLPFSKYACIDCFLVNTLLSKFNLIWMALYIPYAIMSVIFSEGILATIGFLLGLWLLVIANSQWYLLARSIVNKHVIWWLLVIIVYAVIYSPSFVGEHAGIDKLCNIYAIVGEGFTMWDPLYLLLTLFIIGLLLYINRRIQHYLVWMELGKTESEAKGLSLQMNAFNRLGEIGEYLKLEVKGIMRNKNLRKTFIFATLLIIFFSLILSFTEIYDNMLMSNFWCVYCFAIFGAMSLTKIMCYEGNFIDSLMMRKEKIMLLLLAKYYFYSALLLLPFLLMLPTVYTHKCSLLMLISYAVFTAGFEYFLFFQMAVYNKQSMSLNTKFVGKGSMENNWMQVVIQFVVLFLPISFISILQIFFSENISYLILLLTGLLFIATHHYWIANIYRRMMLRRYKNMESFRSSR